MNIEIQEVLKSVGLSENETKVYISLLKHGQTQAGRIVKDTKLHRMVVYNALEKLIQERLAQMTRKKSIQLFQATNPQILSEKTFKLHESVKSILPELEKLRHYTASQVEVRTMSGREGFITNLQEIIASVSRQKDKTMRIIGGGKDTGFYSIIGDWYLNYVALLAKEKIVKKLIAPASYSSQFKKKFAAEPRTFLRTLSKGLSSPTYTRITQDMISFEMYEPEIIIIQIRNAAIASAYLDSFKLLWESAK